MSKTASGLTVDSESVVHFPKDRQCTVHITNRCSNYILSHASVDIESGYCAEMLPPRIHSSSTGTAVFKKTPHTARGTAGVLALDIRDKSTGQSYNKTAVMFSVPDDYDLYGNWYAAGIFDTHTECDHQLFHHMYNDKEDTFSREKANVPLLYKGDQVIIMGTMSNSNEPIIKIEISET